MLTNKVWYVRLESREKGGGMGVVCVGVSVCGGVSVWGGGGGRGSALFSQQAPVQ